ncbi:hypothetical protein K4K54_005437 [Colletotrichum sp. SAR 10_86]|nr:hypothetical protein K4K54_005437 [Colletotrichum sp. SAR 10_86]
MADPRIDIEDRDRSLQSIVSESGKGLVDQLLDVQKAIVDQSKPLQFVRKLDVLYFEPDNKRGAGSDDARSPGKWRRWKGFNAEERSDYIAVSWTWNAAQDEDPRFGGFNVETSLKDDFQPSGVRDEVFERIQHYTSAQRGDLKYVWIDRHCIVQEEGPEKTQGMQAMDLVYGLSGHPISLLARRIDSKEDVRLLADILEGVFITHMTGSAEFRLSPLAVSSSQILRDAMDLLEAITSDLWWSRAWTFQEKYLSESKMKLLIPHSPEIEFEEEKRHKKKVFGTTVGELCVKSIDFHRQKTVSSFIEDESFDGFCPPHSKKPLLFNKGCRFNNVVLTPRGKMTETHWPDKTMYFGG